jgi:hypothetical protein
MTATPAQAVAKSLSITTGYNNLCLMFVRVCYGIAAKYESAKEAWSKATKRHATPTTAGIPVGAPIFFSHPKSKYGHVAIYLGGGLMRTTNSAVGHPVTQRVDLWTSSYGYTLLGWLGDLNGITITGLVVPAALAITGRLDTPTIRALQTRMGTTVDGTITGLRTTNGRVWSDADSRLVRALQAKFGTAQDGKISTPRSNLVAAMQRTYRLPTVDGYISAGYSSLVAEVQRRLNAATF